MARPGVTFSEVAEAASQLIGQGKNPTIEQIRLIIGNGSNSTLANHLRRWKAEQAGDSLIAAREGIPEPLVAMMKGLWDRVMQEADGKMEKMMSEYEDIVSSLKEELSKYKINNQKWQKLHDQWLQEKENLQGANFAQSEQINNLKHQYNILETRWETQAKQLEEKDARNAELNRLHQLVQQNLEHFRESSREQRLAYSLAAEKREAVLQQEIAGLKAALAGSEKGRVEGEKALSASRRECADQQEALAGAKGEMSRLREAQQAVENEHIRLQTQYDEIVKREAGLQDKYAETHSRILVLEKNAVLLEGQLQTVRDTLRRSEERVSTLEHENLFLEKEKISAKKASVESSHEKESV